MNTLVVARVMIAASALALLALSLPRAVARLGDMPAQEAPAKEDTTPPGGPSSEAAAARLASLGWLEGRWSGPSSEAGATLETVYSSPDAGMIVSASKESRDGRTTMFDFERMEVRRGQVVMTPYPFGKPSVGFT